MTLEFSLYYDRGVYMKLKTFFCAFVALVFLASQLMGITNQAHAQYGGGLNAPPEPRLKVTPNQCPNPTSYNLSWKPSTTANYYEIWRTDGSLRESGDGLYAQYFPTDSVSGRVLISRIDETIDFDENDWKDHSPDWPNPRMNPDKFSVRWLGQIRATHTEKYTFTVRVKDKARVWIDDKRIINAWKNRDTAKEVSGTIDLEAGKFYNIKVEYENDKDDAIIQFFWQSPSVAKEIVPKSSLYSSRMDASYIGRANEPSNALTYGSGLLARFYNKSSFEGISASRIEPQINEDWTTVSPDPALDTTREYSAKWTGLVKPRYTEEYTFYVKAPADATLKINSETLLDKKVTGEIATKTIELIADQTYNIEFSLNMKQGGGGPVVLSWESATQQKEVVPASRFSAWHTKNSLTANLEQGKIFGQYYYDKKMNAPVAGNMLVNTPIKFSWGDGAPNTGVSGASMKNDNFSVKWVGYIKPKYDETYTFYLKGKDGIRLTVDGNQIINQWRDRSSPIEKGGDIDLTKNDYYSIQVEYYNASGDASIELMWESPSQPKETVPASAFYSFPLFPSDNTPGNIQGKYWNNTAVSDLPMLSRLEPDIQFNWGSGSTMSDLSTYGTLRPPNGGTNENINVDAGSPDPTVERDTFSARYTGQIESPVSTKADVTFYAKVSDGVRVWINGKRVINGWPKLNTETSQSKDVTGKFEMEPGERYAIRVEYYEGVGDANLNLDWSYPTVARTPIPSSAFRVLRTLGPDNIYTDSAIEPGIEYAYHIYAIGGGGTTPSDWDPWIATLGNTCGAGPQLSLHMTFTPTQTGQAAGPYGITGSRVAVGPKNYHNPLKIAVGRKLPVGTTQKVRETYFALYDKKAVNNAPLGDRPIFVKKLQELITADPKNAILLARGRGTKIGTECIVNDNTSIRIPCSADGNVKDYVWRNGQWADITNSPRLICPKGQTDCSTTSIYQASSINTPFQWELRFEKPFGNKSLYTSVFAITSTGYSTLDAAKTPVSTNPLSSETVD